MSGPFRFNQEPARSPLDRSASPFSSGQPVNFKTNVNRAKTKKWVQAKKNAYDGDDWGDYDEYDEYGVNQEPQQHNEPQAVQRYYAQDQPSRSFTEPAPQGLLPKARRNSFEQGEEQRAFSSTIPHPHQGGGSFFGEPQQQGNSAAYQDNYEPQQQRDFSPTAMPPPLQTRISQVPADFASSPSNIQFPPRKSSISQVESPVASPRSRTGSHSDKPLPFIRPADIYRRVEEERVRERASLDSSRPSLDSLTSRPKDDPSSPADAGKTLHPLETVAERKSEYLPDFDAAFPQNGKQAAVPLSDDQGLRSVVDNAFVRNDDQNSIPPTPISKDSSSDMSRANTGSTTGISPIMSRVPSSTTSAMKIRNQAGDGRTPAIAEEAASEVASPATLPTSAFEPLATHNNPQPPAAGHSRNFSGSSLPRSGFATPTRGDSPARSSVVAPPQDFPEPITAQITTGSLDSPDTMEGGLTGPSPAYATREADLANAAKHSPTGVSPQLGAAETRSQNAFLDSHNAQSPIQDTLPRDRSESPSKGRVQALAGKFGDVSHSRRGSTQSNISRNSRNSVQSWENSRDNSRAASPTKASPSKPSSPVKEFRPHPPGQWESYATTANTPSEQGDRDRELGLTNNNASSPLDAVDLTPTTAKRQVAEADASEDSHTPTKLTEDPVAALKNAGSAMVQSIRTTVGLEDTVSDSQNGNKGQPNHGNIYLPRPLQLERTISSQSSIPPTPPEKNTPESEFAPTLPLKEQSPGVFTHQQRPTLDPQLSTDPSAGDQESDRLRKEIVASLTPVGSSTTPTIERNRASLQPLGSPNNRASSILPSEYETYWAEEDSNTPRLSQDIEHNTPIVSPVVAASNVTHSEEFAKPSMLNRFSWEANNPQLQSQNGPLPAVVMEPTKAPLPQPESKASPTVEHAVEEERQQWSEGNSNSYFGPSHVITVTKPDPITDPHLGERPSTPPLDTTALASPTRERTRSPGLHVVNTREDPEAVDLPPRFSADQQQAPRFSPEDNVALTPLPQTEVTPAVQESSSDRPKTSISHEPSATSPTDKPLGAREIATISSTAERIATYNTTREHWATIDHGLQSWLSSTLESNPELSNQSFPVQRMPTASTRHKHTGSLALLGKLGGTSHHEPNPEQYNSAGAQVPVSSTSPSAARPSGPGFGGRVASQNMQLKGEKLLHTANVLGGKGMTSAKGLFAKGKSRFGRDKQTSLSRHGSVPPSCEASEESEMRPSRSRSSTAMAVTPEKLLIRPSLETSSPNDDKRSRRFSFSSALRRVSRSRSRPNSIAVPSNTPSIFGDTPKDTPPRERSRLFGGRSRPHSFHAPDPWDPSPSVHRPATEQLSSTPPRFEPRLGILPSPAKSAFSTQDKDSEEVPPVPPIPNAVAQKHHRRISQDSTHQMLQSVIRYSTPPARSHGSRPASRPASGKSDTRTGVQEVSEAWKGPRVSETMIAMPGDLEHPALRPVRPRSAPHVPHQREDSNVNINRRSLSAILGPMPFTFVPAELQVLAQANRDKRRRKTRRTSSTVIRDSAEYYRASRPDHDNLLASTGYLVHSHNRPNFDEDDQLRFAQNLVPVLSERGDNWPIVSSAFPSPHHMNDRNSVMDNRAWLPTSNVSPTSPRQVPLDDIPGVDHGLQSSPTYSAERKVEIVSVGDVPVVLQRSDTDEVSAVEERDGDHRNDMRIHDTNQRHMSFQADIIRSGDVTPVSSQEKANALVIPGDYDTLRESPSSLSSLNGAARNRAGDRASESQRRRAYETEVIGAGDVSPISTRSFAMVDEDATPQARKLDPGTTVWFAKSNLQLPKPGVPTIARAQELPNSNSNMLAPSQEAEEAEEAEEPRQSFDSQAGEIALGPGVTRDETLINVGRTPHAHSAANLDPTRPMPYAVHAVEEYSASNSSLASLDHDEPNAALPADSGWRDNMKDESDLVTPVANVPRIVETGLSANKAEGAYNNHVNPTSDDYFPGHPGASGPMHQNSQLQPIPNADMTVPERSKSILSQISAMVSDADTLSPTASTAGRSTPSTIRRMQVETPAKPHVNPNQIPEEAAPTWTNPTAPDHDSTNDYDLYEDHNGFVKDLPSNSKQPSRDVGHPTTSQAEHYAVKPASLAGTASVPASRDGERPRYSTERPMSFVSGPPDEAGKPQDQINRLGPFGPPSDTQVAQIPEQHRAQSGHAQMPSIGMAFSSSEGMQEHWPPGPVNSGNQPVRESAQNHARPEVPSDLPPPQPTHSAHGQSVSGGQETQNGNTNDRNGSDLNASGVSQGQYAPQGSHENAVLMPDHDPMAQGHIPIARNQYGYHQQMMQHQTDERRRHGSASQEPVMPAQYSNHDVFVPEGQSSSKPRLSTILKGIAGKPQQGSQQQSMISNVSASSTLKPHYMDPVRNHSSHSAVSSLSTTHESFARTPNGSIPPIPHTYQTSLGTESQYHHASQPVAPAHPADFPFDGRNPGNVAQYQGIAPQQRTAAAPSNEFPPFHQATASGPAEAGKKKRFSTLGALFGRVSTAGDVLLTKSKEKKAQRAQRHSTPASSQAFHPQTIPQPQQFKPQQPTLAYYPPGQLPPPSVPGMQPMQGSAPQAKPPTALQGAQKVPPRKGAPQSSSLQQGPQQQHQQMVSGVRDETGSAYLRTKQLAEEHRAHSGSGQAKSAPTQNSVLGAQASRASMDQRPANPRQFSWGTASVEHYKPKQKQQSADRDAHAAALAMRQQADQQRQEEQTRGQASYERSQADHLRTQEQHQPADVQQVAYPDPRVNRQQTPQHQQHPMFKGTYGLAQGDSQQFQQVRQQTMSQQEAYEEAIAQRQQSQPHSQQPVSGYGRSRVAQVQELQRQQQEQQHMPRVNGMPSLHNNRSVSGPPPVTHIQNAVRQRYVSSPIAEPQYDAPPIPAAYSHVSGAFVSPHEQIQQPVSSPQPQPTTRFEGTDNGMQSISPQISAQSRMPHNGRTHSDGSAVSIVSPISHSPDLSMNSPPPNQRIQQQRMSSITEVHQNDRPWHLNFPQGATEQEIVRARQRQYMEEQFTTQQQLLAERATQSPSPHAVSAYPITSQDQAQGGGFRELLPRTTPQQYPLAQHAPDFAEQFRQLPQDMQPIQPAPVHPEDSRQPTAYLLPSSPDPQDIRSPVNPIADTLPPPPPPKLSHSPVVLGFPNSHSPLLQEQRRLSHLSPQNNTPPPHDEQYTPPTESTSQHSQTLTDEPPPSYSGPGTPQNGMDKTHPSRPRPSNIDTSHDISHPDSRSRQASIGILQHPQPASMAASPQRSSADMGAESLRRQLLQQEEYARMERIQRAQMARIDSERVNREREAARARARELELSASGGGQVGSLRRVGGSRSGGGVGAEGWERRGSADVRPVFELPAEEDEEPSMKATSYPGQEWVPMMWDD
ncbi:hypothetical protein T440DRAFT_550231 [Plenodomus tracheiphilus IPT5]|uniref:Uncharacterized protein n=1 Tax=Plenodomus tracheiphilus IPT5 TaxID=1408161 RepID=A0A6A7BNB8_9PLEO|nr:hypothetical protein T440DRAFT_550231 [Plenodomus tracheiphilus IPT5]